MAYSLIPSLRAQCEPGSFELTEMGKQAIVDCITDPQNDHLYDMQKDRVATTSPKSPTRVTQLQGSSRLFPHDRQLLAELYNHTLVLATPPQAPPSPN